MDLNKQNEYVYDFPKTIDVRKFDCVKLRLKTVEKIGVWVNATLYPLAIGRPEFINKTNASVFRIIDNEGIVEVPFSIFDYRHMAGAHLKYIDKLKISFSDNENKEIKDIQVMDMQFSKMGDFHVRIETTSRVGNAGDELIYSFVLINEAEHVSYVTIAKEWCGKEIALFTYDKLVKLNAKESKCVLVKTHVPSDMAEGGREKHIFHFIPDGNCSEEHKIVLYVARKIQHPFLMHKNENWGRIREILKRDDDLKQNFQKIYLEPALAWQVPETEISGDCVYYSSSQDDFFRALIAWKVSGNKEIKNKILKYLYGFLDETKGYLSTKKSYFNFVESINEYRKGDFKVHRACSAGWVQEAEFMAKIAFGYDLMYNEPEISSSEHERMEACMRTYIDFSDWRLTDGDGNNFQIAEASAGLFFSMILQDYDWIDRFLEGKNGLKDIMGSVFSDDGSYFEGASNYIRLIDELFIRASIACENFGINLKDAIVPASFDKPVLHSPWALRALSAEDGKPFLGMSFLKAEPVQSPIRRLKDHFDNTFKLLTNKGILFSVNDSNEQDFIPTMEMAYYLFRDEKYVEVTKLAKMPNLLYGKHMIVKNTFLLGKECVCSTGNGFAVLRDYAVDIKEDCDQDAINSPAEEDKKMVQAVLKFGQHGGYHGHFDRLSLVSFIRDNKTFHNMEYAWFGYDSFMFKMWVQTSVSHNMVVVDGRMQEPTKSNCVYFEDNGNFKAACAETISRWSDPPYGGQTPYPYVFPEEKCKIEGRYVLISKCPRRQGEIGEYSEPIFQRRLVILIEDTCFIWDYEEGEAEHIYDCFYHPMGYMESTNLAEKYLSSYYDDNPFGAGQFIRGCHWFEGKGVVKLSFVNEKKRENSYDIIDYVSNTDLYRLYPANGEVMIGHYPKKNDTFSMEETSALQDVRKDDSKKSVCFRQKGKSAKFITAIHIGERKDERLCISCSDYDTIVVTKDNGYSYKLSVSGMDNKECKEIKINYSRIGDG